MIGRVVLAADNTALGDGAWHDLVLLAEGAQFAVMVDTEEVAAVVDEEPLLLPGLILIEARGGMMIDDFQLDEIVPGAEEPGEEPAEEPAATPEEAPPTATPAPAPTQTPAVETPGEKSRDLRAWIYGGVGLAVLAAGAIALALRARKKPA